MDNTNSTVAYSKGDLGQKATRIESAPNTAKDVSGRVASFASAQAGNNNNTKSPGYGQK